MSERDRNRDVTLDILLQIDYMGVKGKLTLRLYRESRTELYFGMWRTKKMEGRKIQNTCLDSPSDAHNRLEHQRREGEKRE